MTNLTESTKNLNGFHYFALGWRLITRPGLKRFVILPLLANIIILGSAFWWLYGQIGEMVNWMMEKVPDWLQWLSYVIWPLSVIFILLVFTYFFSTIEPLYCYCSILFPLLDKLSPQFFGLYLVLG